MKTMLWFLLMVVVLGGLTFCHKEDLSPVTQAGIDSARVANKEGIDTSLAVTQNGLPALSLLRVFSITSVSARVEGKIVDLGNAGSEYVNKGVCWSTIPNPTLNGNKTNGGTVTCLGSFFSIIIFTNILYR
jgi:hypothetical protein